MSSYFDQVKLKRTFISLNDIDLKSEMQKKHKYYPKAVVYGFIRVGITDMGQLKEYIENKDLSKVRNIGPHRIKQALKLIKKYEDETLLLRCHYCNTPSDQLEDMQLNNNSSSVVSLCHQCSNEWSHIENE